MQRRQFIQRIGLTGALAAAHRLPLAAFAKPEFQKLTILHTNDVHSRVEPFPMDGSRYAGMGGAARRAALIDKIRSEEEHVLLFDSGDIFQGTPYFNLFGGEIEFRLMSEMQYDAATIGNHDFDAGIDGLVKQLPHAQFPFVIANYDFSDTAMHGRTLPYKVFEKRDLKIGVFGLGIELYGLVPQNMYGNTVYQDPLAEGQKIASILRDDHDCDYVICLSHLGYRYRGDKVSDIVLGRSTSGIDLILGGHTHTFMDEPKIVESADGKPVYINQTGWAGIRLGRLDIFFERNRKGKCLTCENLWLAPD